MLPSQEGDEPLEVRVASISAEIAAAIAQAQARGYDNEEDEDGEESGSGQEMGTIGPNTSGIRGVSVSDVMVHRERSSSRIREGEEEDDSDAFPAPLRARKARELAASGKRKR